MKKIAIVEDNPDNLFLVESLLEDEFETLAFADGDEALAGIPGSGAHVILMDISLPRMDGTEVMSRLRSEHGVTDTPVIALTAHAMRGDRERLIDQGFTDYVSKPIVDDEAFLTLVRKLANRGG